MYIPCQSRLELNFADMFFPVQNRLIQMRITPALWNIKVEQLCEYLGRFACYIVSPSAERNEQFFILIKCHVTMHHPAKSDRTECMYRNTVLPFHVLRHLLIAVLNTFPNVFDRSEERRVGQ